MLLENAWGTVFILGIILASSLLPSLARQTFSLWWRSQTVALSQALMISAYTFLSDTVSRSTLPVLCALAFVSLNEQVRFLCVPQDRLRTIILGYLAFLVGTTCILYFLPASFAFSVSGCLAIISFVCLLLLTHHKNTFHFAHIQQLLICTLLLTIASLLLLTTVYWQLDSLLIHQLILICIMSSVISNQWASAQYRTLQQSKDHHTEDYSHHLHNHDDEHQKNLQNLSHDMRTPLSGILGMAELLLETPLSPAQREYTQTIQSSGNALLHLLDDRLDTTRQQDQGLTILEEVFEAAELLNYCLDLFKNEAENKNIELVGYLDSTLPKHLLGDAVRLRQVMSRLIHNAIRFTDIGEVVISIRSAIWQNDLGVQFSVQDTGIGMNESKLTALFIPQMQENTHEAWYTGPNIATCAQLVTAMSGELTVTSALYEGTMAAFSLPLKTPNSVFTDSTTEFIASFASKRLLIVDDNRTVSKVLAEQATQWGMRVSSAESGTEALAVARNAANLGQSFDVIIMDYQMPGMSGLQLGARLKQDALITNDVILIMLTGLRQNNIQTLARNAGIHRVISKPITSKQLRQAISQELKRLQGVNRPELNNEDSQLGRIKVLVAEDNQLSQKVIRGMLQKLGVNHSLVNNGREAVQAVMREHFDMILMDCDMPFVDGYTATQEIRHWEQQEGRNALPILALTAHILEEQKQKAINSGMNEHLSKPIELGDLQNALLRWCPH
ncbi:MAG: response regulator [Agitococcus sp.]|nr:response regulator [Agitococcus sp.]